MRDGAALESACARPHNLWSYEDEYRLAHLGAALICAIGRNHPFLQGNKRTAFGAAVIFFENNGYVFDHPDSDDLAQLIEDAVLGHVHESALADELDDFLVEELF